MAQILCISRRCDASFSHSIDEANVLVMHHQYLLLRGEALCDSYSS